jgi:hypothetical protein
LKEDEEKEGRRRRRRGRRKQWRQQAVFLGKPERFPQAHKR